MCRTNGVKSEQVINLDISDVCQLSYIKLDTLAGLARSSDKRVTNLLSLAEGQYSSYHLQVGLWGNKMWEVGFSL